MTGHSTGARVPEEPAVRRWLRTGPGPRVVWRVALTFSLAACGPIPTVVQEAQPSPTAATQAPLTWGPAETPQEPVAALLPITMQNPAAVLEPPASTPTPTPLALPARLPPERLVILEPGPGSQVTSPFTVTGRSGPCYQNRVRIRLLGEDGRVLDQRLTYLWAPLGHSGMFTSELSFRIELVAEAARLEVSTQDIRSTRLGHLATLNVVLLSVGAPRVYPGMEGPERLTILSPRERASVSGGVVWVQGAGWVEAEVPLAVQLVDREGTVIAAADAWLEAPAVGQLGMFEVTLTYRIPYPQPVWVTVAERTADGGALVHLSSQEIWLQP